MMVVAVNMTKVSVETGPPKPLFETHMAELGSVESAFNYDVSADGQQFVVNSAALAEAPLTVMINWTAGIGK